MISSGWGALGERHAAQVIVIDEADDDQVFCGAASANERVERVIGRWTRFSGYAANNSAAAGLEYTASSFSECYYYFLSPEKWMS